jgi:hypothetical protein
MKDLRDDQLPEEQDPATLPVMGRGKYHPDYVWIVRGLEVTGQTQAALAKHLGWDESIMSRQLKGQRELKARELQSIHSFFERFGLSHRTEPSSPKEPLTIGPHTSHTGDTGREEMEGKRMLSDTIKDVGRLEDRLKAVEARLDALERGAKGAKKGPM